MEARIFLLLFPKKELLLYQIYQRHHLVSFFIVTRSNAIHYLPSNNTTITHNFNFFHSSNFSLSLFSFSRMPLSMSIYFHRTCGVERSKNKREKIDIGGYMRLLARDGTSLFNKFFIQKFIKIKSKNP